DGIEKMNQEIFVFFAAENGFENTIYGWVDFMFHWLLIWPPFNVIKENGGQQKHVTHPFHAKVSLRETFA
ncbi:MAG: hypothetical protein DRR16_28570, partial [Candidatus Parabeggiatoa sp. nov. 3]